MTSGNAVLVSIAGSVLAAALLLPAAAGGQSTIASQPGACAAADSALAAPDNARTEPSVNEQLPASSTVAATGKLIHELQIESFPELRHIDLQVRTFNSESDYLRTRFSVFRFFVPVRMRYYIDLNPALFARGAPGNGLCAIVVHELAHIVVLSRGNRVRRLGLIRLLSKSQTRRFERGADLDAIHLGYGDGLKRYRIWVYANIPQRKLAEKMRNYFSPDEIAAIQQRLQQEPDLFAYWTRHIPMSLAEIKSQH